MWNEQRRRTVRIIGIVLAVIAVASMLVYPLDTESDSSFDFFRGLAFGLGAAAVLISFAKPKKG